MKGIFIVASQDMTDATMPQTSNTFNKHSNFHFPTPKCYSVVTICYSSTVCIKVKCLQHVTLLLSRLAILDILAGGDEAFDHRTSQLPSQPQDHCHGQSISTLASKSKTRCLLVAPSFLVTIETQTPKFRLRNMLLSLSEACPVLRFL